MQKLLPSFGGLINQLNQSPVFKTFFGLILNYQNNSALFTMQRFLISWFCCCYG